MALDLTTSRLPADIQAVLGMSPYGTAAAADLAHVMAEEQDWAGSDSCGDGFPVEFAFHTRKDTLCWTADPFHGQSATAQWSGVLRLAAELGDPVRHPVARLLPDLEIPLRAGSWISGRRGPGGYAGCKVYTDWQNCPRGRAALPHLHLPERLANGARPIPRGLGLGPGPGRAELYYKLHFASLRHVHHLLCFAGLELRSQEVCATLEAHAKGCIESALANTGLIASIAEDAPGSDRTVTLYLYPRAFRGNDARARSWFLARLSEAGRAAETYACASAALADRVHYNLFHGLVALTVSQKGLGWGIGLRPKAIR